MITKEYWNIKGYKNNLLKNVGILKYNFLKMIAYYKIQIICYFMCWKQ